MNILICHGCRQNDEIIQSLFRDYVKKIKKIQPDANFTYLNGQYYHPDKGRMWYETVLDLERIGTDDIPESDINNTLDYLESVIKANNINILIGFSQGGNLVSTYLRLRNQNYHIKRAAIISGYDFPKYTEEFLEIDQLILVFSKNDEIVNYHLAPSIRISKESIIMEHNKGHKINQQGSFITQFVTNLFN
jgi:predicted esterase